MKWVFALMIIAILLFVVGCSTISSSSLKEYRVNADSYVGKKITISDRVSLIGYSLGDISANYGTFMYGYKFVDDEGYFVDVMSNSRAFEKDKFYTVTGTFIKASSGNYYLIES